MGNKMERQPQRQTDLQAAIEKEIISIIQSGARLLAIGVPQVSSPLTENVLGCPGSITLEPGKEFRSIYRIGGYAYWITLKKDGNSVYFTFERKSP